MTVCKEYNDGASYSDSCRYNCHLNQRCAAAYESLNSRCSWEVLRWMFNHDSYKKGVAAQIKKMNKKCLLTHCHCSSLNLAVRDSVKNIPLLKDTLNMAYDITKLIKKSSKSEA